ncbi:MAG: tRNA (adenosine(37)-N6)-threonylcarbamoyltransferase complex dimerization subunit type 1 TsaB [Blastocatellia bacterium]|nr:tRNA (adenosine(37)-N6)-threonylcarbamoyltransferase complex dimerization subunit type 1 TsaB [Blastocatellia bacterium]
MKQKEMTSKPRIVLAIEAAIRGGSIALLEESREAASWHGTADKSRAEDLLSNIENLFEKANISKQNVSSIAVSNGPGSYTGIRIGIATALGLKNALEIECIGVSLLSSIAYAHSELKKNIIAVPIGRAEICWQPFNAMRSGAEARSGTVEDFLEAARGLSDFSILLHRELYDSLRSDPRFGVLQSRMIDGGQNLAVAVGIAAQIPDMVSDLQPFYIQTSRFTPVNV